MARSAQLARFLEYIVGRTLNGDAQSIKAYAIAVDVFGRPANFDPQADPIVRVQARRLRVLLDQYYRGPGADDAMRITLPTGRYVPEFVPRDAAPAPEADVEQEPLAPPEAGGPPSRSRVLQSWMLLAVFSVAVALVALALPNWGAMRNGFRADPGLLNAPRLLVMDFQNLATEAFAVEPTAGLALELVTDLQQFDTITVAYGGPMTAEGATQVADYVLSGIARRDANRLQYSAILTYVPTGTVVWNRSIVLESFEASRRDLIDFVSGNISRVLGSSRGPLHASARALLASRASIAGGETPYLCRMLFDLYQNVPSAEARQRAQLCYDALSEADRDGGPALAARAMLIADDSGGDDHRLAMAQDMLAAAVSAAPTSGFVWEQRARVYEMLERHADAEAAYNASIQLNPADTDTLAARARHLALLGSMPEATRLSLLSMDGAVDAPAWYYGVPAMAALQRRDFVAAAADAARYSDADGELGPLLAILAGDGLRDAEVINRYLPRVLEVPSFRAPGILTQLRKRVVDETLLSTIAAVLLRAGVPQRALDSRF